MKATYKNQFTRLYSCRGLARDHDNKEHGSRPGDRAVPECLHPKHYVVMGWSREGEGEKELEERGSEKQRQRKSVNWQLPVLLKPQSLTAVKHFLQGPAS